MTLGLTIITMIIQTAAVAMITPAVVVAMMITPAAGGATVMTTQAVVATLAVAVGAMMIKIFTSGVAPVTVSVLV